MSALNGERIYLKIYLAWLIQAVVSIWIVYLLPDAAGDDANLLSEHFLKLKDFFLPIRTS